MSSQRSLLSFFNSTPSKKPLATLGVAGAAVRHESTGKEPHTPSSQAKAPPRGEHDSEKKQKRAEERVAEREAEQEATVVKKKTRVADDLDKDLLLFDDEAAWEDVKSPVSQPLSQQPSSEPASAVAAAALSTPFGFGAYSRGAPPVGDQPNPKARRALMEADFGLNVKEEMEEWKQNKCPWLEDVRDAEKRRPSDEGYDKSTLFISKEQLAKLTLPQRQYWDVKSRYFDWIVWFQVGSFYELYAEDAMLGQSLLGLKIHSKGSAGVPAVRIDEWVERFVSHGHKVVVVTQSDEMEGQNKKRIVTEIVSAGTVLEPNDAATGSIFIMSVSAGRPASAGGSRTFAVTFCDLSLLESHVARFDDDKDLSMLLNVLEVVGPKELVFCPTALSARDRQRVKGVLPDIIFSTIDAKSWWMAHQTRLNVCDCLRKVGAPEVVPDALANDDLVAESFGGLLQYLISRHSLGNKASLLAQSSCLPYVVGSKVTSVASADASGAVMILDAATLKNLDVFVSSGGGGHSRDAGTLWALLNFTCNAMGTRLLRRWITQPLCDFAKIKDRQAAIGALMERRLDEVVCDSLRKYLKSVGDMERILCRVFAKLEVKVPHFLSLVNGFKNLAKLLASGAVIATAKQCGSPMLERLLTLGSADMPNFVPFLEECTSFWITNKDGLLEIKEGFGDEAMVEARKNLKEARRGIEGLLKQAQDTVNSKAVFKINGPDYLFEVPAASTKDDKIPKDWKEEKVSAKTKRRFGSKELRACASRLADAQLDFDRLSAVAVAGIMAKFGQGYEMWRQALRSVAALDCLLSLSSACLAFGESCFPEFGRESACELVEMRNPVVERSVIASGNSYIPNTIRLDAPVSLITGPNAGGKSTVLRTVAVSSLLAQIGCKVPAVSAKLPLVDRIFTRIGARDDIMQGKSTFMVELEETASILNQATPRSLLILDELGRGTSTSDGYAIAWAVLRRLAEVRALTLFATHYHGLCSDFAKNSNVALSHVAFMTDDTAGEIVFLYQLKNGPAGGSYGLNVARLAGLPESILARAAALSEECQRSGMFETNTSAATVSDLLRCKTDAEVRELVEFAFGK